MRQPPIWAASDVPSCGHDDGESQQDGCDPLTENHALLQSRVLVSRTGKLRQGLAAQQSLNPGGNDGAKSTEAQNLFLPAEARGMQKMPEVPAAHDRDQRGAHLRAKKFVCVCPGGSRQGESAAGPKHTG
jgi:hypothetical protein